MRPQKLVEIALLTWLGTWGCTEGKLGKADTTNGDDAGRNAASDVPPRAAPGEFGDMLPGRGNEADSGAPGDDATDDDATDDDATDDDATDDDALGDDATDDDAPGDDATDDDATDDDSPPSRDAGAGMLDAAGDAGQDAGSAALSADAGADAGPTLPAPLALEPAAGYVDIEAVDYVYAGKTLSASSARLFYSLIPAEANSADAPLFVFFNGGPGSATTSFLYLFGTGPHTLGDLDDPTLQVNPHSWTQLGNLLYIDARLTGFSYSTLPDPSSLEARNAELAERNFNTYIDAADFARTLVRVLRAHPQLTDNPVVIVGESYGGTRASMLSYILTSPASLRSATNRYQDPTLADELEAHYQDVLGAAPPFSFEQITEQIAARVLIQPYLGRDQFDVLRANWCEPGSAEQTAATEDGVACPPNTRDVYDISQPESYGDLFDGVSADVIHEPANLELLFGMAPEDVAGLGAASRTGAFRTPGRGTGDPAALLERLGALEPWDAYHLPSASDGWRADVLQEPDGCATFLTTARYIPTLVTNARNDTVVQTKNLKAVLEGCARLFSPPPISDVTLTDPDSSGMGLITLSFTEESTGSPGGIEYDMLWPSYDAGHVVSARAPQDLFEDVQVLLQQAGLPRSVLEL